jgi:hypothetical protein
VGGLGSFIREFRVGGNVLDDDSGCGRRAVRQSGMVPLAVGRGGGQGAASAMSGSLAMETMTVVWHARAGAATSRG